MGVIDEVKQKIDIVEIVGQYVQLTKSGRTMRAPCPFHSEKKPSFFVYPEQQTWHCFGACNTGGDVFSFIMKKENLDFGETLRLLAEKTGVTIPSQAKSEAEDNARDKIFNINQSAAQYFHNLLLSSPAAEIARQYLTGRGLNEKSISDFQLGYSLPGWESLKQYLIEKGFTEHELISAGLIIQAEGTDKTHDRFRHHIMFPIMDDRGRVTGFGARVLDDSSPKYTNSPQTRIFDKSGSLYGIHLAKSAIRQQDQAVLVEGYMDVIVSHQYGFNNIIAPMGVAITEKQINHIKKLTRNISLALDPDVAGEEAALRCINFENTLEAIVKVISLPAGQDPDEVIKTDRTVWQNAVDKAVPVIEYAINIITSKLDMKSSVGKTAAVNQILPIIAEVKAGPRQFEYLSKLSSLIGVEAKDIEGSLRRFKSEGKLKETRAQALQKATRVIRSNPIEEYTLSLILKNPGLKSAEHSLLPEYFENSENRAIFDKWQQFKQLESLRENLDSAIQEHYDTIVKRDLPPSQIEEKYLDCILRLRERYLRNLKRRQEGALTLEAESGDKAAVLAKLLEQGIGIDEQLAKLFALRGKLHGETNNEKKR